MQTKENTDLAVVETKKMPALMRPIATPAQLIESYNEAQRIIKGALKENVDYGTIPGTKSPTLYKAGAEKLVKAFGAVPDYEIIEHEVNHDRENKYEKKTWNKARRSYDYEPATSYGFYRYVVRCTISSHDGRQVANAIGSCSTMEQKYISRPRDTENTVLKMAQKRAFVAATLNAFGLSDRLTQDLEDVPTPPKNAATRQTTQPAIEVFNLESTGHQERLKTILESRSVPEDRWEEFAVAMVGKEMNQQTVINISKELGL